MQLRESDQTRGAIVLQRLPTTPSPPDSGGAGKAAVVKLSNPPATTWATCSASRCRRQSTTAAAPLRSSSAPSSLGCSGGSARSGEPFSSAPSSLRAMTPLLPAIPANRLVRLWPNSFEPVAQAGLESERGCHRRIASAPHRYGISTGDCPRGGQARTIDSLEVGCCVGGEQRSRSGDATWPRARRPPARGRAPALPGRVGRADRRRS